jgi:2,3-dihydroxybenzoate-AMP ligase
MAVLPITHNYALGTCGMIGTWYHKGKVIISAPFDAATAFSLIQKEKVTVIPAVGNAVYAGR